MILHLSAPLLPLLLGLRLAGCAETTSSDDVVSSTTLLREYEKTLTRPQQESVIRDLQSARAKQQQIGKD
jgi:hypothetical protein